MKCKKFYSIFAAIAIACSQVVVPAFATETTPNGDWIDTSSMTPVYEVDSYSSKSTWGTITSDKKMIDFIVDFSVTMSTNDRYQIGRVLGDTSPKWVDIRQIWATDTRKEGDTTGSTQSFGKHVQRLQPSGGWFDTREADADYPIYTDGKNIAFRLQVKDGTLSLWAAELDETGAGDYKYAGNYTYNGLKNQYGLVTLIIGSANDEVTNIKMYNLASDAEIEIENATTAALTLSDAPSEELEAGDITLTDSFGTTITATGIEKVSDTKYTLTFADSLQAGVIYSGEVDAVNTLGGTYLENTDYYMNAALDVDFDDELWKDYIGVYASGNINNPTNALWKNNQIELQETYSVITKDSYESNSIIEFDGMITTANNAETNKAKLQLNKNAEQYSEGVSKDFNSIWIYDHDTGKKPQYFLKQNGIWALKNLTFNGEAIVKRGTMYSFRVVTAGTTVSLYMKEATSNSDYAFVGTYSNEAMKTNDGRIELCANNTGSINGAIYDNIRVYETDSVATAEMKNNVITVNYSVEPSAVLTAENVTVTKSDDSAATVVGVTRTGVTTYEIALEEVEGGETYTVASTVKNIYGADLKEAEVQAPETEELGYTLTTGTESTTAVIEGAATAPDAVVIFAVYDGVCLENITVKKMSQIDTATNSFTFGGVAEGQTGRLYIWDSLTGLEPLVK